MKVIKKSICIILTLVSILALNACGGNGEKESETYPPAKEMTVERIYEDYRENALRAEDTHRGERYRCKVKILDIYEDYVRVDVEDAMWVAAYLYYQGQEDFVMNLSKDDVIIFEGTFTRFAKQEERYKDAILYFEDVVFISKVDQLLDS